METTTDLWKTTTDVWKQQQIYGNNNRLMETTTDLWKTTFL